MRCCGALAPVCVIQAAMLIKSDDGGFKCANGAAQERNWLVQVWGDLALSCGGGLLHTASMDVLLDDLHVHVVQHVSAGGSGLNVPGFRQYSAH